MCCEAVTSFVIVTFAVLVLRHCCRRPYKVLLNARFGQRILRYKGTQLWNRLPNNLSNNTAFQAFRNMLKLLLICDQL